MKKLLLISSTFDSGHGWGRYSLAMAGQLSRDFACSALVHDGSDDADFEQHSGLSHPGRAHSPTTLLANTRRIHRAARDADLVFVLVEPYAPAAAIAARRLRLPLVLSGVGTYSVKPLVHKSQRLPMLYALRTAQAVPCISRYTEKRILQHVNLTSTCTVPLGVDDRFHRVPKISKEDFIISVGAIKARKGHVFAMEAFGKLKRRFPDLRYVIVGDAGDREYVGQVFAVADRLGVRDAVEIQESVTDDALNELYNRARLVVVPSINEGQHFEGFGLVYLEANACGTPAIGSRDTGAEEPIVHGYNGRLATQRDPSDIARCMEHILEPERYDRYVQNSLDRVQQLTWKEAGDQMLALMHRILG